MLISSQEEASTTGISFSDARSMMHRRFHNLNEGIAQAVNLEELFREMDVALRVACRLHGHMILDTEVETPESRTRLEQAARTVDLVELHIHWLDYMQMAGVLARR